MAKKEELKQLMGKPIKLAPNTYLHFYKGGKLRAWFVGEKNCKDDYRSEEWIFSTNRAVTPGRPNPPDKGLSRVQLPSGKFALLKDLLAAFPNETLGKAHYKKYGPTLGLLVKIFDVGDGAHIPVHWHPSPAFATKHLHSPYGKNEAWILVGTRPGAEAWIGWKRNIKKEELKAWVEAQDVPAMRAQMHHVKPKVGDVIFLRDSFAHSLGAGVCILEPQEPTDWNILAEWKGYPFGKNDCTLGLSWETALQAVDYKKMALDYLNNYVKRTPVVVRTEGKAKEYRLVPEEAKKYFMVYRIVVPPGEMLTMPADRGFYCTVTTGGEGKLVGPFPEVCTRRGVSYFIPTSLSKYAFVCTGKEPLVVVCCYPPKA